MGVGAYASYRLLFAVTSSNGISTLLSIGLAVLIYGALILLLKGITKDEIARLPKGDKLVRLLGRFLR